MPLRQAKKKRPSAAAAARAAFDAVLPKPSSDVPLPECRRVLIEQARPPPPRLLSRAEMLKRVSLTYPTVWKMMIAGTFPRGRAIGNGRVAWLESDIDAWILALPRQTLKGDPAAAA